MGKYVTGYLRNWGRDSASFCAALYLPHRYWLGAAALWLMAALLRWWVAPLELWMQLTFAAAGLIWIAAGFYTLRRGAK